MVKVNPHAVTRTFVSGRGMVKGPVYKQTAQLVEPTKKLVEGVVKDVMGKVGAHVKNQVTEHGPEVVAEVMKIKGKMNAGVQRTVDDLKPARTLKGKGSGASLSELLEQYSKKNMGKVGTVNPRVKGSSGFQLYGTGISEM